MWGYTRYKFASMGSMCYSSKQHEFKYPLVCHKFIQIIHQNLHIGPCRARWAQGPGLHPSPVVKFDFQSCSGHIFVPFQSYFNCPMGSEIVYHVCKDLLHYRPTLHSRGKACGECLPFIPASNDAPFPFPSLGCLQNEP